MIPADHLPTDFEMMDDMADMSEKVSTLEKLNRLFREGLQALEALHDTRWGDMGSGADYVPRLERHLKETLQ